MSRRQRGRVNIVQATIVAHQLREQGYADPSKAPLEAWLRLGFLQRPSEQLIAAIAEILADDDMPPQEQIDAKAWGSDQ